MAQRKSPPAKASGKTAASRPAGRGAGATKATGTKAPGRPPARKPGKSIVNQKQTPWGLIISTIAVVVFAAAVVIVVVATHKSGKTTGSSSNSTSTSTGGQGVNKNDPYRQPELAAAKAINGVVYHVEGQHNHVEGVVKYDTSPPTGGNHSQYWADCTGSIYAKPIASENAVHMLEHGAIWVTYDANKIKGADLTKLEAYVKGVDRMAMSPYPNLKAPISLQAWGYQLFVNSPTDPRIAQFISVLKYNQKTTPEYGATCSQPTFKQHPSTYGHPLWQPANGDTGNTMSS